MILVTFPLLHGYAWAHQTFAKPTTLHTHHAHHHSCAPLPYLSYPLNPFLSLLSTIHSTTTTYIFHTHRFPSFISIKPNHHNAFTRTTHHLLHHSTHLALGSLPSPSHTNEFPCAWPPSFPHILIRTISTING